MITPATTDTDMITALSLLVVVDVKLEQSICEHVNPVKYNPPCDLQVVASDVSVQVSARQHAVLFNSSTNRISDTAALVVPSSPTVSNGVDVVGEMIFFSDS